MESDSDDFQYSDDEIDHRKHEKLVSDVLNLNKTQNLKKPSRTEPTLKISEFDLVKSVTGNQGTIELKELTKVLKSKKKHLQISQKLQSTRKRSQTLPKPLEKPQATRIRRAVSYEKSRLQLDKWESVVTSNRAAPYLSFPLGDTTSLKLEAKKADNFPNTWRVKSDLQKEIEDLEKKYVEEYHVETEKEKETFPLTMEEIMERRKEAAKLRAHQSYKEAKARRQNKIKSKKFHRIQRREKIKKSLKEFEELQKTNPEEALKKLEDIEKARAEERFSLRHKGTGQWAKNKQIRAKYDKESRQALAQQLAVSRDLTQKLKKSNDSDTEDEGIETEETLPSGEITGSDNPWVNGMKPDKEVVDFVSGYRKFWNEHNKSAQNLEGGDKTSGEIENKEDAEADAKILNADDTQDSSDLEDDEEISEETKEESKLATNKKGKKVRKNSNEKSTPIKEKEESKVDSNKKSKKRKGKQNENTTPKENKKLKMKNNKNESNLNESKETETESDLENIFDTLEHKLQKKMEQKYTKIDKELNPKKNKKLKSKTKTKDTKTKKIDLTMKTKPKKAIIDEELLEKPTNRNKTDEDHGEEDESGNITVTKDLLNLQKILETPDESSKKTDIDPNKFIKSKPTNLSTAIPDILTAHENEENDNQRDVILEAFEDDDITNEFSKEKMDEIDKDKPKDINLNLPGWGSWGGTGIKPNKRKQKRFIIKMPEKMPRRDDNKGSLIINEKAQSKIKQHMVSEVPFPFKTVKDYEASVRAPISNSFVPETAYKKLIRPSVTTKMGVIIEPMTRDILLGK